MNKIKRTGWGSEIRATDREGKQIITGHAAMFDKLSQNLGGFVEKIARGAFAESISKRDVVALWSHNIDLVLGRVSNKSLRVYEDDEGLAFELELPDTTLGRDAYKSIERGDVRGMSFGFSVQEQEWARGAEGQPHTRTLKKIDLFEISPTAFPAYDATDVSVRDAEGLLKELESQWAKEGDLWKRQSELEAWRPSI